VTAVLSAAVTAFLLAALWAGPMGPNWVAPKADRMDSLLESRLAAPLAYCSVDPMVIAVGGQSAARRACSTVGEMAGQLAGWLDAGFSWSVLRSVAR
jgi:hypothetical protein